MDMKKLILLLLKAVPCIGVLACASNSMLSYFGFNLEWLGYAAILFFFVVWFMLAKFFGFCSFYYILVLYIITREALNLLDYYVGVPVSNKGFFILHISLFGFYALLYTFLHVRDTKKLKRHLT